MGRSVSLGIVDQGWEDSAVPDDEVFEAVKEVARAADSLGFRSFWLGEHHGAPRDADVRSRFSVPEIALANLAAETERIVVGTGVKVLRTTNPFRCAEEMAMLDLVTNGRAEFGIGLGSSPTPMTPAQKQADFRAKLDDILRLFARETLDGRPPLSPIPDSTLRQRLWTAPRDTETIDFVAARGINLVVGQAEVAEVQRGYVDRYRAGAGNGLVRGVRLVYIAESREQALAEIRECAEFYFQLMGGVGGYTGEAIKKGYLPERIDSFEDLLRAGNFIVGDPDTVATELNAYVTATGVDILDVMVRIPRVPIENVLRTLALLQSAVAPALGLQP